MNYQDIISDFQSDIRKGLASLFNAYGQKLYGYALKNWTLDEDESYEALYKTLEAIGKVIIRYEFISQSHFNNWLFKVHKNNILQLLRAKKAKGEDAQTISYYEWEKEANQLQDFDFQIAGYKPIIDRVSAINPYKESPEQSQLMLAMQKALQQVTDLERELLLLRMNNYSYDEIANMLGIENIQLKVKYLRAKAKVEKKTLEILKDSKHEAI